MTDISRESIVIYAGDEYNQTPSATPPIFQTSTFSSSDSADFVANATNPLPSTFYTRYGNPTLAHAAAIIARLENAENALVFASGMGAAATTALALLKAGDHVVAQRHLYTGNIGLLKDLLGKFGVSVTFVDQIDSANFSKAITRQTRLIWVETPSNPLLRLTDLAAVAKIGKAHNIFTLCDNTVATPMNQHPIELGFDLVLHSATKAMGGHSDISAGAIAGSHELIERIWHASILVGATLGPIDAWLLLRGLRTLPLRSERLNKTALKVAQFLDGHPRVRVVHYPGLESHPQSELAKRQMAGAGCLLSFELDASEEETDRFIQQLRHVRYAVSLGGVDSLLMRPAAVWSLHATPAELERDGIAPSLVRLSVGLEHPDDLISDLEQALKNAT